jgi:hydrogenase-4 component H
MRYPKLRELREAIKALIRGPYTTEFPFKPHIPEDKFRGAPKFFEKECVGCTACVQVCPSGSLRFKDEVQNGKAVRKIVNRLDICIFCGQCQANCITERGIRLTQEFDLATLNRDKLVDTVEKGLVLCDSCGQAIAPLEHILWVAKKLGPLAYSNPSVFLAHLQASALAEPVRESAQAQTLPGRARRISIICPRCRREVVLKS